MSENGNTVGFFNKRPAPGYTWFNPDDPNDLRVRWNPGEVHEEYAHVFASDTEGMWRAEEGYSWGPNASSENLTVFWLPGVAHPVFPHVVTREEEGEWGPADGYVWVNPDSSEDLSVYWEPGEAHSEYSHVVAGSEEGKWITEEGYSWVSPDDPDDWSVQWVPGKAHGQHAHVYTSDEEGVWLSEDGYSWVSPGTEDLSVHWVAGTPSRFHANLLTGAVEGEWEPAAGYDWVDREDASNRDVAPIPADPVPETRNALIQGTGVRMAYSTPTNATPEQRRKAEEMLRAQSELAGVDFTRGLDTDRYDFAVGIAASTNIFLDLSSRVLLDQLSQGRATPELQAEYEWIRGKSFNEVGCHSNGAMICLAALQNGDIKARHVVLYGPQITVESLSMWDAMVREGRIGSIQMFINENDPVPPLSLLTSATANFGSVSVAGMPLFFSTDAMQLAVQTLAPSIHVTTSTCSSSIPSLVCHEMATYRAARGCVSTPESSGLSVPGTALPGQRPLTEPPPPC